MAFFFQNPANRFRSMLIFVCLVAGVLVAAVSGYGYSENYEGYLGETIALHGVSYNSNQVYLFMTGPGLPENGVTLTDTSRRADQGQFTTVDVDSSQQWSFRWDTSKIENQIDPGTYTVYVSNSPVDKSNLAGSSYQTLTAYLKAGQLSKNRVSVGTQYTLNLVDDDPDVTYTLRTVLPTSPPTTEVPDTTITTVPPTSTPTKKSAVLPTVAILAVMVGSFFLIRRNQE